MSRTAAISVLAAVFVAALVALLVWQPFGDDESIRTRALGAWQESAATLPVRMTISSKHGVAGGDGEYWVTYPLMSDTPFPGRLDGDRILVFDSEQRDVLWSIAYDAGADALIVTQPGGGDSFILRRISE